MGEPTAALEHVEEEAGVEAVGEGLDVEEGEVVVGAEVEVEDAVVVSTLWHLSYLMDPDSSNQAEEANREPRCHWTVQYVVSFILFNPRIPLYY